MIQEGKIVLFAFPQTDQTSGKLRPALLLRRCPGTHGDCLICMISSQLRHEITGLDEIVRPSDDDFARSGLKMTSVIRATRLAVVSPDVLQGTIGTLSGARLHRLHRNIADWVRGSKTGPDLSPIDRVEHPAGSERRLALRSFSRDVRER